MTLTDLQVELRNMGNHLSLLEQEIERMKPKENDKSDFDAITALAENHPITNNSRLSEESEETRRKYIKTVGYLALSDQIGTYEKLLFLTRLARGLHVDGDAETLLCMSLGYDKNDILLIGEELKEYRFSLLLDTLITMNTASEMSEENAETAAVAAEVMNIDKEEIKIIALVAKAVVTNDFSILEDIEPQTENKWSVLNHYMPDDWLISQRTRCKLPTVVANNINSKVVAAFAVTSSLMNMFANNIKRLVPSGKSVKKGQLLISYDTVEGKKEITAPKDGIVFFDKINENAALPDAYIVSYFDDYSRFHSWYIKEKNGGNQDENIHE